MLQPQFHPQQDDQQQQLQQQQPNTVDPSKQMMHNLPQQFSHMQLNNNVQRPILVPPQKLQQGNSNIINPILQPPPQFNLPLLTGGAPGGNPLMRPTFPIRSTQDGQQQPPQNASNTQLPTAPPAQFQLPPQFQPPPSFNQQQQQNGPPTQQPQFHQPPSFAAAAQNSSTTANTNTNNNNSPQQFQSPTPPHFQSAERHTPQPQVSELSSAPPTQLQGPPQFQQQQYQAGPPQQQQPQSNLGQQNQFQHRQTTESPNTTAPPPTQFNPQPSGPQLPPSFNQQYQQQGPPTSFAPQSNGPAPQQPQQFQPPQFTHPPQQQQQQFQTAPPSFGQTNGPPPQSQFQSVQPPPMTSFGQPNGPPQQFQPPSTGQQFQSQPPVNGQYQGPPLPSQQQQFGQPQFQPGQPPQLSRGYPTVPPPTGPLTGPPTGVSSGHPLQNRYPQMAPPLLSGMNMSTPTPPIPTAQQQGPPQFGQPPAQFTNQYSGPPPPTLPGQFPPSQQQPQLPQQQRLPYPNQLQQQQSMQQQQPPVASAAASATQRIDPDAIPNPIDVMQACNAKNVGLFRTFEPGAVPPLTVTDFTCQDEGQCNPRFMRSTMYTVPTTQDFIKNSRLPIALAITPFATLKPDEHEPPVSNLGELGPVRCKRCKAYMSPYMNFIDNGRRFQCPYCEDITPVPQEYFNHLDHMGKRVDQMQRPELLLGSYEFIATKDYCRNQTLPTVPAFIFLIDVSLNSVRSGMLKLLCDSIRNDILHDLPKEYGQERSSLRVGFITYDKELHFYNLKSSLATPQMMIVSDLDDIFVPILDGFLVDVQESAAVIDSLLEQLPNMFADNKETELILGPAIEAGIEALQAAKCNGKLFVFHTGLPTVACNGQLKNRDDKKLLGTDKEKQLLAPQTDYYTNLGKKCIDIGCCVDLFLMTNQFCDVASMCEVLCKSGGQIYKYDFFMADTCGERLLYDLKMSIKNTISFDAVMKVRTSTGIKPLDYLGNFNLNGNDVELCGCDRDKTVCVELKHEDKLNENSKVYIQVAILYTSISGQRRIRLHNLMLNVSNQYSALYPSCELDTIMNYISKLACRSVLHSNPKSIHDNIIQQVANILACYRKNCASTASKGQFILPETLKLMPLYVNSLLKSDAITGAKNVTVDERAYQMFRLMCMDVQSSFAYFYPRLISLHDLDGPTVPKQIRCSYERLKDDGIYLLENGLIMYLWIGSAVSPAHIQNLFGAQSQQANIEKCKLLDIDTPISINVRSVIGKINEQRNSMLRLIVTRQKDTLEQFFRNYLVEDKCMHSGAPSYVDFLYQLHHEIRNILS